MAISVVQRVSNGQTTGSTSSFSLTVAAPSANNLLVAVGASRDVSSTLAIGTMTGFTKVDDEGGLGGDNMNIAIFYKVATGSEGTSIALTGMTNSKPAFFFAEISGDWSDIATNPPKFASTNGSGTTGSTGTTATTTVASAYAVGGLVGFGSAAGFTSWTNSFTERMDFDTTSTGGNRIFLGVADNIESSTGTKTTGATIGASVAWGGVIAVFEEAASGTTHEGTAAMDVTVSVAATGVRVRLGTAALSVTVSSSNIAGLRTAVGTAALASAVSLTATGLPTRKGAAALAAAVTLASTGTNLSTTKTGEAALAVAVTLGDITTLHTGVGTAALQSTVILGDITTTYTGVRTAALGLTVTVNAEGEAISTFEYPYSGPYWAGGIPEFLREKAKKFWEDTKNKHVPDREV